MASATLVRHRPHGVLAVFGPYNFPAIYRICHIVPALLAGNTLIFKPSELTPWTGETVIKLWERAGLPAGVLPSGAGRPGRPTSAGVPARRSDGPLFTGSASTGYQRFIVVLSASRKKYWPENGGNNPLIIDAMWCKYRCGGTSDAAIGVYYRRTCCTRRDAFCKTGCAGRCAFLARLADVAGRPQVRQMGTTIRSRLSAD